MDAQGSIDMMIEAVQGADHILVSSPRSIGLSGMGPCIAAAIRGWRMSLAGPLVPTFSIG